MDVVETGTTLEQNGLVPIETLLRSTANLVANPASLQDANKREKILDIMSMLKGAVEGAKKLHIFVNVHKDNLEKLIQSLPALRNPTISKLSDENWYSVNTIIDKEFLIKALPTFQETFPGARGARTKTVLPLEEIESFGNGSDSCFLLRNL